MSIVTSSTRTFPGFQVQLTYQIGCATTHDEPSDETYEKAQADQARRFVELTPDIERAYAFFSQGAHPFGRRRSWLSPEDTGRSEPYYWLDADVQLFLRGGTPEILRTKVMYDFALSAAFDDDLRRRSPFAGDLPEGGGLRELVIGHYWLSQFLAFALRKPAEFRRLAGAEVSDYSEANARFRARALQKVLNGAPYGEELLAELGSVDRRESIRYLVLFSGEPQQAELPRLVALSREAGFEDYFEPLLG